MEPQSMENNFIEMANLDFVLMSSLDQSSLPTDEINNLLRYDPDTSESFPDINIDDINPSLNTDLYSDFFIDPALYETYSVDSSIVNDANELFGTDPEIFHSTESNDVAEPIQSTDEQLAMIKSNDSALPVIRPQIEKLQIKPVPDPSINLSKSVNVSIVTPKQLQIVYQLEDTYRARYKSDYFPQTGAVRRPRYVADNQGNHFVTLQMPAEYHRDFKFEYIRVALITTAIDGRGHFYSPYKFQINHNDVKVPDQNPIYMPVQAHQGNNFTMKLQLVLIKSKLDQLYDAQPLKSFSHDIGNIQNIINETKLTSKELINKYQLDKSHIAFTLCTKLPNGSYDAHHETTIISSVITETSKQSGTSKQSSPSTNESESVVNNTGKTVCCPNCSHSFDPTTATVIEKGAKRKSNASSTVINSKAVTTSRTMKKKKVA